MEILSRYIKRFCNLRTARLNGQAAPHKPVLLLSVLAQMDRGAIMENRIYITPELVATFKDYWHQLVHNGIFTPNFSLPFYHLKGDGFWHHQTCLGREIVLTSSHSIKSFAQLKEIIDYAYFNEDLFVLLLSKPAREMIKHALLSTYFPHKHLITEKNELVDEIVHQILNEPATAYRSKADTFDEEEVFIRSGIFKKEIPRLYNYTCSISGMRVIASKEIQMIDACHIVPFSESHDDTISNGISLCPNLHRAFDRGLIAIDENYRMLVQPFHEEYNGYSIKQFEGKQILLPALKKYFPSQDNLAQHRKRFGF